VGACLGVAVAALLSACNPLQYAEYRHAASAERDPVPPLYQGPLTVEYQWDHRPAVFYTDHGFQRLDLGAPPYTAHVVADVRQPYRYFWRDSGPQKGQIETERTPSGLEANLRQWRARAEGLGSCSFAGETGRWYRTLRAPNFKGWDREYVQACITADGVVLADAVYAGKLDPNRIGRWAIRVERGPLPTWVRSIPAQQEPRN